VNDAQADGAESDSKDRKMWGKDADAPPTDVEDIQGFTALINGQSTKQKLDAACSTAGEKSPALRSSTRQQ